MKAGQILAPQVDGSMDSDTPRTDAAWQAAHDSQNNVILAEVNNLATIAKTLERELATDRETLAFYRAAYEKTFARAESLEKDNTRLYEQEALHTESYGIVCADRDRAVKALSDAIRERDNAMNANLLRVTRYLPPPSGDAVVSEDSMPPSYAELRSYAEQLQADALKVVEGFDEGAFCRDVAHDAESGWAMKLLPYMVALGRLTANVRNPPVAGAALSKNTHGDSNAPPVVGTHEELEPYGTRPSAVEEGSGSNGGARSDELRAGRAQCGARAASAETDRSEVAEGAGAIPARTELNGVRNSGWILLSERQPEMGQCCLVFPDECDEVGMDTFGWDGKRPQFIEDGLTHWMPLPRVPTADEPAQGSHSSASTGDSPPSQFNAGVEAAASALEQHSGQGPLHSADLRKLKQ